MKKSNNVKVKEERKWEGKKKKKKSRSCGKCRYHKGREQFFSFTGHLMWWHKLGPLAPFIIVALVVACLIAVIILICIIICMCRRRRKRSSKSK